MKAASPHQLVRSRFIHPRRHLHACRATGPGNGFFTGAPNSTIRSRGKFSSWRSDMATLSAFANARCGRTVRLADTLQRTSSISGRLWRTALAALALSALFGFAASARQSPQPQPEPAPPTGVAPSTPPASIRRRATPRLRRAGLKTSGGGCRGSVSSDRHNPHGKTS